MFLRLLKLCYEQGCKSSQLPLLVQTQEFSRRYIRSNRKTGIGIGLVGSHFSPLNLTGENYLQLLEDVLILPWLILVKIFKSMMQIIWCLNGMVLLRIILWLFVNIQTNIFHCSGLEEKATLKSLYSRCPIF